jgi:glutathione synthase/RimK-type ligase-like ATP-grasp enzyme
VILIIAPPDDLHARRVAQEIELEGHTAQIVSWRRAGKGLRASLSYEGNLADFVLQSEEGEVVSARPSDFRAIWNRRPSPPDIPLGVLDSEHRRFARQEWQDLLDGLTLTLGFKSQIINPLPAQRAAVKPYQLAVAQSVGLQVPKTLISSDPQQAKKFLDVHKGRVVHKAMTNPRNAFMDTRRWQDTENGALNRLPLAPTIFQELIEGPLDIRATIVGAEIYAAAISTEQSRAGLDSRLDLDVPTTSYEVPREIAGRLRGLMAALGLSFATVDLKVDYSGRLHFLELNPQGQFLYVEILTGLPISKAVAKLLTET